MKSVRCHSTSNARRWGLTRCQRQSFRAGSDPVTDPAWATFGDEQLLEIRMCDLGLTIEGTDIEARIAQLNTELDARGLTFRPYYWLSDEWFTPDGVPGIAIPFYLAHPRLAKLEFAQMLDHWYAQSHPDEDFAETFAVWLDPHSMWASRYAGWPAQRKLEYMDRLMRELARRRPRVTSKRQLDPLPRLKKTLGEHYRKKREHYGLDHPDFYY